MCFINKLNLRTMEGIFDINSPKWLGGTNVHNTVTIVLALAIAWKVGVFKK